MEHAAPMTIRICHLYPRLLSVAGDRGNLLALTRRCDWRGIQYRVAEAEVGEVPDFTEFDLILLHGGQDCEMRVAAGDLGRKAGSLARGDRGRRRGPGGLRRLPAPRQLLRPRRRAADRRDRGA